MSTSVRSVTVRLDALVSKYVADMRMAGRETDKAFASAHSSMASTNRELGVAHTRLGVVNNDLGLTNRRVMTLSKRLDPVRGSLTQLNSATGPGSITTLGNNAERTGNQIDRMSGRLKIIADLVAIFGPGLIPVAALVGPTIGGLAAGFGFAAVGAGALITSVQGVGAALKAVNAYALDPTDEKLQAARDAMRDLTPEARAFVTEARDMVPLLKDLRDAGAEEFFPGLTRGMHELETLAPDIERIIANTAGTVGDLLGDNATSLASDRWAEFFNFLARETSDTLVVLNHALGDVAHGAAEMWMAFDPANDSFLDWISEAADGFDDWASSEQGRREIADFLTYARENGPAVADAFESIGNMLLQVVEASSPLGGPVLKALSAVADVVADVADSDLGTPLFVGVAAMSAYSRATALATTSTGRFIASQITAKNVVGETYVKMGGLAKSAAVLAGVTLASSDMGDSLELSNTASLALIGTMGGPWGVALGAAAGFALDFAAANDQIEESLTRVEEAFRSGSLQEQRQALRELKTAADEGSAGFLDLGDAVGLVTNPVAAAKSSFLLLSGATGEARAEYDRFKSHLKNSANIGALLGEPLGVAEDAFLDADAAMRKFTRSFERLNNLLTDRQTLIDYERALDDLQKTAKDNEFNPDFEKGRRGLERMSALTQAAIDRAQALREAGDELGAVRILRRAIDDLTTFGKRSPAAKEAVEDLIAELERLDRKHAKPKLDADNKPAKGKIDQTNSWLLDYSKRRPEAHVDADTSNAWAKFFAIDRWQPDDKFMTVHVGVSGSASVGIPSAAGNFFPAVKYNAYGDFANRHQPEMTRRGVTRVWNEPETGGESYIPHANDGRRARAKSILEQTAHLFNGDVRWGNERGGGGRTVVVERVVEKLPSQVVLRTDDGAFRAYVVGHASATARSEIDTDRDFDQLVRGR